MRWKGLANEFLAGEAGACCQVLDSSAGMGRVISHLVHNIIRLYTTSVGTPKCRLAVAQKTKQDIALIPSVWLSLDVSFWRV